MTARITFVGIAAFWAAMNFFLWRQEFTGHADDLPVPTKLVWRKILTAPDASSMTIYQGQARRGYCELTTSVEQQMAVLEEDKVPPEGLVKRSGYQLHLTGSFAFDEPANRFKFDSRVTFDSACRWSELTLKISSRAAAVEIHSLATNENVHLKITGENLAVDRDLTLAELKTPATLIGLFAGDSGESFLGGFDLQDFIAQPSASSVEWSAVRTRVKFGAEFIPIYQLTTAVLDRECIVDVSTLGEVLRVRLPGGITAAIDEWSKP